MKLLKVEEAVGSVLCHDLTRIIPGKSKGPAFKKGHIITEEDIPELLRMGKEHIYAWEAGPGILHENEAALRMAEAAAGDNIVLTEPAEGKVSLKSTVKGLLKVSRATLELLNTQDQLMMATLPGNRVVQEETVVAATRIIPLVIEEDKIKHIEEVCDREGPIVKVMPLMPKRTGLIITGSEVYRGRIKDSFGPVVVKKLERYSCEVFRRVIVSDDAEQIAESVKQLLAEGAEMVLVTGGMSVDPDDLTPTGIRMAGGTIVTYGTPVLPGAMFMLSYIGDIPVLGLPGCVMYAKTTVFDIVLPRVLAGERLEKKDFAVMGYGGLCRSCEVCRFPDCTLTTGY